MDTYKGPTHNKVLRDSNKQHIFFSLVPRLKISVVRFRHSVKCICTGTKNCAIPRRWICLILRSAQKNKVLAIARGLSCSIMFDTVCRVQNACYAAHFGTCTATPFLKVASRMSYS